MKKYSLPVLINIFLSGLIFLPQQLGAQNKDSIQLQKLTDWVTNQQYSFIAQSVNPLSGRQRQLDSQYDLKVSKEQVVADLPYFGIAYFSPVNPSDAGIHFTSKTFEYSLTKRKKDGWNVLVKSKDLNDQQDLNLTIYSNGKATLQVTSNRRQAISFNGYIIAPDKEKTDTH
ncbi:MAG: DUF4251 domain-containing protein [Bacteroidota bacterium]